MKTVSSSSYQSKPLLMYLVVSLLFSAGRLNGEEYEEPFLSLIAQENAYQKKLSVPQLETTKTTLVITSPPFVSGYDYSVSFPPPFSIDLITPPLVEESYMTKKRSPFRIKKSINFSREIARNEKEEFLPSPVIPERISDPLLADPNLERKMEEKYDFLSKDVPLVLERKPLASSSPYSFKHPQEESALIDHDFSLKKSAVEPTTPLKELHTAHPTSSYIATEEKKNIDLFPQFENLHKHPFDTDNYYFYFDDSFPFTPPYPLEDELVFSEKLFRSFSPLKKEKSPGKYYFAESYFKSIKWVDVSKLIEARVLPPLLPSLEENGNQFARDQKVIDLTIPSTSSSLPSFEKSPHPFSFPYRSYISGKKALDIPPLDYQTFEGSPYHYVESFEELYVPQHYLPTREKAIPLPTKYSLSEGPTLAMELDSKVVSFTLTPSFDLYCSDGSLSIPKKAQEFKESAFALIYPYLYPNEYESFDNKRPTPKFEKQDPIAFNETNDALNLTPNIPPSSSLSVEKNTLEEPLSIISRSIEFPHGKTESSSLDLALDHEPFLRTLMEEKDQESPFSPSVEPTTSPLFDQKLDLEIASQKYLQVFAITSGTQAFDHSLKHPFFPKHHQTEFSSNLKIKDKFKIDQKEFIDDRVVAQNYLPSTQKEKGSFEESIPEISLPKSESHSFPLETTQNIPLAIHAEQIDYEKYPHLKIEKSNPYELPLPFVKRKEIIPKVDGKSPKKMIEDVPGMESMAALVERRVTFPNTKTVLIPPSYPTPEIGSLEEGSHPLKEPLRPAYYPPIVPNLDLMATSPSMKEEHLEYVKKKTLPFEPFTNDFELPYLADKRITPHKQLMMPKNAFEDIPGADKVIGLTTRDIKFPMTRAIVERHPAPDRVPAELNEVETTMIRSQAKEIIEDYDEENRLSAGLIALATPELVDGPTDSETRTFNQSNRFTRAFLTEIPPPSHLETVTYHNEFTTDVHYSSRDDGKGYLFAIKMKPGEKLTFASPSQHFIFVIDGSSSIKKHRFGIFKEGVARALSYLSEGDSFNIIVADADLIPFSKTATPWTKESAAKAKRFLLDRSYRGFFINYDAFDLLSNVSNYFAPDKENIVVLITDGHSFSTIKEHKKDFKELTKASKGKFSVFTATANQNNNLSMLDLLSTFNNGELMYSKTNAAFSRQLAVLVKHIESFVAKDIHINMTSINQETGIEFYPNEKSLPSLYADRPYTIYGSIDKLKDFDLILQGRCGDQWINIKQTISFKHAQKASHTIKKGIALQKAYVCYDYFLDDENPFYLSEAQRILEPLRIPTATR